MSCECICHRENHYCEECCDGPPAMPSSPGLAQLIAGIDVVCDGCGSHIRNLNIEPIEATLRSLKADNERLCAQLSSRGIEELTTLFTELRDAAMALQPKMDVADPAWAKVEWTRIEALRVAFAKTPKTVCMG